MKRILLIGLFLVLGFYGAVAVSLVYLRFLPPLTTGVQVQRRVEALFSGDEYRKRYEFTRLDELSDNLERAVVAAEDTRFYLHRGIDWEELRKARAEASREGSAPRGASTISQQLVKNLYFTTHRSYLRKGLELTITPMAEVILGKERILELYLNVIEWGPGVYGATAAAQYHYSTSAESLSRDRAARLAAVIPAPRSRTPGAMNAYSGTIQSRMRQMGW